MLDPYGAGKPTSTTQKGLASSILTKLKAGSITPQQASAAFDQGSYALRRQKLMLGPRHVAADPLFSHALSDIGGMVNPHTYINLVRHPIEGAKGIGSFYKGLATHPIRTFEAHPVMTLLAAKGVVKGGAGLSGGLRDIPHQVSKAMDTGPRNNGDLINGKGTRTIPTMYNSFGRLASEERGSIFGSPDGKRPASDHPAFDRYGPNTDQYNLANYPAHELGSTGNYGVDEPAQTVNDILNGPPGKNNLNFLAQQLAKRERARANDVTRANVQPNSPLFDDLAKAQMGMHPDTGFRPPDGFAFGRGPLPEPPAPNDSVAYGQKMLGPASGRQPLAIQPPPDQFLGRQVHGHQDAQLTDKLVTHMRGQGMDPSRFPQGQIEGADITSRQRGIRDAANSNMGMYKNAPGEFSQGDLAKMRELMKDPRYARMIDLMMRNAYGRRN